MAFKEKRVCPSPLTVPFTEALPHSRDTQSDHHVRCFPDESKAVPVELKAGGALFFNCGVPHCTRGNETDADRAGLALHFLRTDCRNQEYERDGMYRGPYLRGPLANGGRQEHGVMVEGTWDAEVETVLNR